MKGCMTSLDISNAPQPAQTWIRTLSKCWISFGMISTNWTCGLLKFNQAINTVCQYKSHIDNNYLIIHSKGLVSVLLDPFATTFVSMRLPFLSQPANADARWHWMRSLLSSLKTQGIDHDWPILVLLAVAIVVVPSWHAITGRRISQKKPCEFSFCQFL